jgi:hypothetical protein
MLEVEQNVTDNNSLLALAQGAKIYKLCRPRMTRDNVLRIKGGRYVTPHC